MTLPDIFRENQDVIPAVDQLLDEYRRSGAQTNYKQGLYLNPDIDFEKEELAAYLNIGGAPLIWRPAIADRVPPSSLLLNKINGQSYREVLNNSFGGNQDHQPWTVYDQFPNNHYLKYFQEGIARFGGLHFIYHGIPDDLRFKDLPESDKELNVAQAAIVNSKPGSAARERARWMTEMIRRQIAIHTESHGVAQPVTLLSIASGSAEPELTALKQVLQVDPSLQANLLLVDIDGEAHNFAMRLAQNMGLLGGNVAIETANINVVTQRKVLVKNVRDAMNTYFGRDHADITVMLGLLDYFKNPLTRKTLKSVYELTEPGASLATAQVRPMTEPQRFELYEFYKWKKMVHRDVNDFALLAQQAGFDLGVSQLETTSPQTEHTLTLALLRRS